MPLGVAGAKGVVVYAARLRINRGAVEELAQLGMHVGAVRGAVLDNDDAGLLERAKMSAALKRGTLAGSPSGAGNRAPAPPTLRVSAISFSLALL